MFVAAVGVTWYLARGSGDHTETEAELEVEFEEQGEESEEKSSPDHSQQSPSKQVDIRKKLAEVVEKEVRPLKGILKVDNYLRLLKERALEKQRVTALEVQPGIEAIMALEPELGLDEVNRRIKVFSDEMLSLSREFGHVPDPPNPLTEVEVTEP
jgi:hypothetical protein